MIALGFDVSSLSTGWAVIKRGRFYKREGLDYGIIKGSSKYPIGKRLAIFREAVSDVIEMINPDLIAIEDVFAGPNRKTFKVLSRFNGVAIEACKSLGGIEPVIVPVTQLRAVWGTQAKQEIYEKIVAKYKLDNFTFNKHNDITDAVAIAWYVYKTQGVNNEN